MPTTRAARTDAIASRVEPGLRYAVSWRDADGEASGNLVLDGDHLLLRGVQEDGTRAQRRVPLERIGTVRIGRSGAERIRGERSVVIDLEDGTTIGIAPLGEAGAVFELADLVSELGAVASKDRSSPVVVVLPLREGTADRARELVGEGPPFDLEEAGLDRHQVFVTEREVVFLFDGREVREELERLLRSPTVLRVATTWSPCVGGRPRLADECYSWRRGGR